MRLARFVAFCKGRTSVRPFSLPPATGRLRSKHLPPFLLPLCAYAVGRSVPSVDIKTYGGQMNVGTIREYLLNGSAKELSVAAFVSIMQGCNQQVLHVLHGAPPARREMQAEGYHHSLAGFAAACQNGSVSGFVGKR